ncbi:bifunctional phosphopantothenoylcysteine decarboxylase/phosphopantothenate--cysteine ligase CoaBC [Facilibium subflavum]|uniref:bifunctional phosphopantothenoylcysteine decarboxylase/phosphopantothenate--cysteine ligase CoaBC n=1 Tax=Facilibium subflavum TaxID=2219058 RepID=UPI000E658871|nr:bifunctional phosphopantothenoylcysteine decarboxylase/phosphopantothenate--cysteine ligase CoaBC [Facilibium subflavum]
MKNILLCVTGSIAVYKSVELVRLFIKSGYCVKVVMTSGAKKFVTPLTFESISAHPVYDDTFSYTDDPIEHIDLARWADLVVIAPASANTIARLACGLAEDLLGNIVLACNKKIMLAPAMNRYMWQNSVVQENVQKLVDRGFVLLSPQEGEQACGDVGLGRLMEPLDILKIVEDQHAGSQDNNRCVVITAGPTIEAIDPVRYISNHSSGKMGYALAESFKSKGWQVILISGPTRLSKPQGMVFIEVETAQQMYEAVHEHIAKADVFIAAAAVVDYRMKTQQGQKIKKSDDNDSLSLELVKNKDILKSVSLMDNRPFCVGFAAETHHAEQNAQTKIKIKKLDMLVLNQVDINSGFPFYATDNKVDIYNHLGAQIASLAVMSKKEVAMKIAHLVEHALQDKEQVQEDDVTKD